MNHCSHCIWLTALLEYFDLAHVSHNKLAVEVVDLYNGIFPEYVVIQVEQGIKERKTREQAAAKYSIGYCTNTGI